MNSALVIPRIITTFPRCALRLFIWLVCWGFTAALFASPPRFPDAQLAVHERLAAASLGKTVYLVDITSPAQPRLVSKTSFSQAVKSLALQMPLLCVGLNDGAIQFLDITHPQSPLTSATLQLN